MRRALAIDEASYGAEHPNVAIRLNNLARLLQDTNRLAEAEPLQRRSLEILLHFKRATGHDHPELAKFTNNYRICLDQMNYKPTQIRVRLNNVAAPFDLRLQNDAWSFVN